jgi:hypothetical protein
MDSENLFLDLHYLSIVLAIVVPLYYWYVRKDRQSVVLKVARGVRAVNGIFYFVATGYTLEVFWNDLQLGMPLILALLIISYLLVRRWAPKQVPLLT